MVTIVNASGKIVYSKNYILQPGENKLEITDVKALTRGLYMMKIKSASQTVIEKFIKQ